MQQAHRIAIELSHSKILGPRFLHSLCHISAGTQDVSMWTYISADLHYSRGGVIVLFTMNHLPLISALAFHEFSLNLDPVCLHHHPSICLRRLFLLLFLVVFLVLRCLRNNVFIIAIRVFLMNEQFFKFR